MIDGKVVPEEHYELISGSTIIKISDAYLKSLGPGKHEMVAWYKDGGNGKATFVTENVPVNDNDTNDISGEANGPDNKDHLSVVKDIYNDQPESRDITLANLPGTGDQTNNAVALLIMIGGLAFFCLVMSGLMYKREKDLQETYSID